MLALTVAEACDIFEDESAIMRPLTLLRDIGLDYVKLGQPRPSCPAGKHSASSWRPNYNARNAAPRYTSWMSRRQGYTPRDIDRLLVQLNRLVEAGDTVVVVEHNNAHYRAMRLGN